MDHLERFFESISGSLWGDWLLYVLIGVGLLYTVGTRFIQFRLFGYAINESIIKPYSKNGTTSQGTGTIKPFQALATALASCVGSGNIIGVSTALISGGPGAVFWMWVAALVGMATKFAEITLGIHFRTKDEAGVYVGGPMYYIRDGLKLPKLAFLTAIFMTIQIISGNLIQSNAISGVLLNMFQVPRQFSSILIFIALFLVVVGGIKRLSSFAQNLVPVMVAVYLIGALIVILLNLRQVPQAFLLIFRGAFNLQSGIAGFAGYSIRQAMRYGVARGLYSNEAGEGSAPVLHSGAITDHPCRQGLFGIAEVFIDTIVICTVTALVLLVTGIYSSGAPATVMVANGFATVHPLMRYVVGISLVLFAFTSLTAQWYFGYVAISYFAGNRKAVNFKYIFPFFSILGAVSTIDLVWYIQDTALGLLVIPNLIALIFLYPLVISYTREFTGILAREKNRTS